MKEYEIEKGVPRYNYWDALTAKMEVGDSVLFPSRGKARMLTSSLKAQGFKFTGQAVPDGYRIWKEEGEDYADLRDWVRRKEGEDYAD